MCCASVTRKNRQTPNRTHANAQMTLKSRVLFQSPASTPNKSATIISTTPASHSSIRTPTATPIASTSSCSSQVSNSLTEDDTEDDLLLESNEFELLSETITKLQNASQIISGCSKKSVGFAQDTFENDVENIENRYVTDLKSRHKSEPNLTQILSDSNRCLEMPHNDPIESVHSSHRIGGTGGRYIANKLLKGVSMVNLMLPTSSPSIRKSTSSLFRSNEHLSTILTRSPSSVTNRSDDVDSNMRTPVARTPITDEFEEDIDDPDFVATPNSQRTSRRNSEHDDFSEGYQTPVLARQEHRLLGRKSMSPITKSTQRMSKAMQVTNFSQASLN